MPEHEYRYHTIDGAATASVRGEQPAETVDIPEDAIGVSLDTFGDDVWVRYLVPADGGDDA